MKFPVFSLLNREFDPNTGGEGFAADCVLRQHRFLSLVVSRSMQKMPGLKALLAPFRAPRISSILINYYNLKVWPGFLRRPVAELRWPGGGLWRSLASRGVSLHCGVPRSCAVIVAGSRNRPMTRPRPARALSLPRYSIRPRRYRARGTPGAGSDGYSVPEDPSPWRGPRPWLSGRPPAAWSSMPNHVFRHGRLADVDPKFE